MVIVYTLFSDSKSIHNFYYSLETYGAKVTQLTAEVGSRPSQDAIREAISKTNYKFVTVTHVDTS